MNKVHIVFGPQGAGKSTYSKKLSQEVRGIHMSIDQWMWKLYGPDLPQPMNLKWIMERVDRCEKLIWSLSKDIVASGIDVILDLGFTKSAKRNDFINLAKAANLITQLHYIHAPYNIRKQRVLDRNITKGDTFSFEVTPSMFDFMEGEFHSATDTELAKAIVIETNH